MSANISVVTDLFKKSSNFRSLSGISNISYETFEKKNSISSLFE